MQILLQEELKYVNSKNIVIDRLINYNHYVSSKLKEI